MGFDGLLQLVLETLRVLITGTLKRERMSGERFGEQTFRAAPSARSTPFVEPNLQELVIRAENFDESR